MIQCSLVWHRVPARAARLDPVAQATAGDRLTLTPSRRRILTGYERVSHVQATVTTLAKNSSRRAGHNCADGTPPGPGARVPRYVVGMEGCFGCPN